MDDLRWFVNRKNKKSVMYSMKKAEIRTKVLAYLQDFFSTFMLYKEFPVKKKMYTEVWALDMYEQLTDEQRVAIYLKQTKKNDDGN